jgi:hypothetical protein
MEVTSVSKRSNLSDKIIRYTNVFRDIINGSDLKTNVEDFILREGKPSRNSKNSRKRRYSMSRIKIRKILDNLLKSKSREEGEITSDKNPNRAQFFWTHNTRFESTGNCYICNAQITSNCTAHVEHVIPILELYLIASNIEFRNSLFENLLQIAHRFCNSMKGGARLLKFSIIQNSGKIYAELNEEEIDSLSKNIHKTSNAIKPRTDPAVIEMHNLRNTSGRSDLVVDGLNVAKEKHSVYIPKKDRKSIGKNNEDEYRAIQLKSAESIKQSFTEHLTLVKNAINENSNINVIEFVKNLYALKSRVLSTNVAKGIKKTKNRRPTKANKTRNKRT